MHLRPCRLSLSDWLVLSGAPRSDIGVERAQQEEQGNQSTLPTRGPERIQTTNSLAVLEPDLPAPSSLGAPVSAAAAVSTPPRFRSRRWQTFRPCSGWSGDPPSVGRRRVPGATGSSDPRPSIKGFSESWEAVGFPRPSRQLYFWAASRYENNVLSRRSSKLHYKLLPNLLRQDMEVDSIVGPRGFY